MSDGSPVPSNTPNPISPRDRDALIRSLSAGEVPARGLHLIQVGRARETERIIADIDQIAGGGSSFLLAGAPPGFGKTFLQHTAKAIAHAKNMVVAEADLLPEQRLHSTSGQARALYAALMTSLSTRSRPDGAALPSVVEKFISSARDEARTRSTAVEDVLRERLASLEEMNGGATFVKVIAAYWDGLEEPTGQLLLEALRWLRGEFTTKSDARNALGVRTFVDDANVLDHLKLFARFARLAGYTGLFVCLDEAANLCEIVNPTARRANQEAFLGILNDCTRGRASGIGFLVCGTPELLDHPRRGLTSHPALRTRLEDNPFAVNGLVDLHGPVIRLAPLGREELFVLLHRVRHVYASGNPAKYLIPDEGIEAYRAKCEGRIGDASFRTPRNTVKGLVGMLAVLEQNPGTSWKDLVPQVEIAPEGEDPSPDGDKGDGDDGKRDSTSPEDDGLAPARI